MANVTLNDFRNLLGRWNDGNVVFKQAPNGVGGEVLGKVNYGHFYAHEPTPDSAAMNQRVRNAFMDAIKGSVEGECLSEEARARIQHFLGIDDVRTLSKPLARRDIKNVLNLIDRDTRGAFNDMVVGVHKALEAKNVNNIYVEGWAKEQLTRNPAFATAEGILQRLPANGFCGFTRTQMAKFVNDNLLSVQKHLFDRLFWRGRMAVNGELRSPADVKDRAVLEAAGLTTARAFVQETLKEMMASFAQHREPPTRTSLLHAELGRDYSHPEEKVNGEVSTAFKETFDKMEDVLRALFYDKEPVTAPEVNLSRFGRMIGPSIQWKCSDTFVANHSDLGLARTYLTETLGKTGFLKLSAEDIAAIDGQLAPERRLVTRFRHAFFARVNVVREQGREPGELAPEEVVKMAGEAWQEVLAPSDLEAALARYVHELMPNEPQPLVEAALKAANEALAGADANRTKAIRLGMYRLGATELPEELKTLVENAVKNRVEGAVKDCATTFALLGASDEKGECVLEAAKYLEVLPGQNDDATKTLRGKVLAYVTRVGYEAARQAGVLNNNYAYVDKPENRATVEREVAKLSPEECRFVYYYLARGCGLAEQGKFGDSYVLNRRPLYNALRDGVIDIRDMTPRMMDFLGEAYLYSQDATTTVSVGTEQEEDKRIDNLAWVCGKVRAALLADPETKKLMPDSAFEKEPTDRAGLRDMLTWTPEMIEDGYPFTANLLMPGNFGLPELGLDKVIAYLTDAGVKPEDLDTREGYLRAHLLSRVVSCHNNRIDGALEWAERILGKPMAEVPMDDLIRFVAKAGVGRVTDPLTALKGAPRALGDVFAGTLRLAEAPLTPADLVAIRNGLRTLLGGAASAKVQVAGVTVDLHLTATKAFVATLEADGKRLPVRSPLNVPNFALQIEDNLIAQADKVDPAVLKEILPRPGDNAIGVSRARELCTKVLVAKFGIAGVTLASLPTARLAELAAAAVDGQLKKEDLALELPKNYNGADTIELHNAFIRADPKTQELVKIVATEDPKPLDPQARAEREPTPADVRNFLADIVMNGNTWAFDGAKAGNARLTDVFRAWEPEWAKISADPDKYLATLPDSVRAAFRDFVVACQEAGAPDEAKVDALVNAVIDTLQASVDRVFATPPHEEKPLWQQSTTEMLGSNGLDISTPNGRFLQKVLSQYFTKGDRIEKRAALSAFLRNTDAASTEGKQVAELLKGAGPLLQKMLQGLAIESFAPETQVALADMKSRLPSIPEEVVKAQMLDLIRSSGGNITSITVTRSLGAATVGQAFLCHIVTKEHPISGEDVVIKLRRPNVMTSVQREHALFARIADELQDGLPQSFEMQYRGVLEELDFTHEAGNVDLGLQAYERPTSSGGKMLGDIRSMARHTGVAPTEGALVLAKVNGTTFDSYIQSTRARINEISSAREHGLPGEENRRSAVKATLHELVEERVALGAIRKELEANRKRLAAFTDVWVSNALLGNGLMHGDLHAGNLMTDQENLTVIDFGNALRLTPDQQKGILRLMTSTMAAAPDDFVKALRLMLPPAEQAKLDRAADALKPQLTEAFSRGNLYNGASRLAAAVALVQRAKVGLPQELVCFTQSLVRLKATMSGLDDNIRLVDNDLSVLTLDPDAYTPEADVAGLTLMIPGKDGELHDILAPLENYAKAFGGEVGKGFDLGAVKEAREAYSKVTERLNVDDLPTDKAAPYVLKGTLDDIAYLKGLGRRLERLAHHGHAENGGETDLDRMTRDLDAYEAIIRSGDAEKIEEKRLWYGNQVLQTVHAIENEIYQNQSKIPSAPATLPPFEEAVAGAIENQLQKTIKVLTGEDIDLNVEGFFAQAAVAAKILGAFKNAGSYGVVTLASNLEKAQEANTAFAEALAAARTRALGRADRVPTETMVTLEMTGRDYRAPAKDAKGVTLADIVSANVAAAREALAAQRREPVPALTTAEAQFLADILAASSAWGGKPLATAVKGLAQDKFDALVKSAAPDVADVLLALRA